VWVNETTLTCDMKRHVAGESQLYIGNDLDIDMHATYGYCNTACALFALLTSVSNFALHAHADQIFSAYGEDGPIDKASLNSVEVLLHPSCVAGTFLATLGDVNCAVCPYGKPKYPLLGSYVC